MSIRYISKRELFSDVRIKRKLNGLFDVEVCSVGFRAQYEVVLTGWPFAKKGTFENKTWYEVRSLLTEIHDEYPNLMVTPFVKKYFEHQTKWGRIVLVVKSLFI